MPTSLLGAFYLHLLLTGHPHAKISIGPETGATAMILADTGQARPEDLINITITHDWGRPDPRGPDRESVLWTFKRGANGRIERIANRPPCELQTVIHRKDMGDVRFIDRIAQTAAHRLERELERGYSEIRADRGRVENYTWDTDRAILPAKSVDGTAEPAGLLNTITTNYTSAGQITREDHERAFRALDTH